MIVKLLKKSPTLKIKSASRLCLNKLLLHYFKQLKAGIVLDVGAKGSPYKEHIPHTKYMTLDIEKSHNPDICCDLQDIKWKSNYFDIVIATEVIEHLEEPQKSVNEIHRVLKRGGICILSTPFIHSYHPDPKDYYRFTKDSLEHLFRKFSTVEIQGYGNRLHAIWGMLVGGKAAIILNIFNPLIARLNIKDDLFPLGFIVYAKKRDKQNPG